MKNPKLPKVIEKKIAHTRADGLYFTPEGRKPGHILIDPRLKPERRLEVMIHEMTHHLQPTLDEAEVQRIGDLMSQFLWLHNYRRIDQ